MVYADDSEPQSLRRSTTCLGQITTVITLKQCYQTPLIFYTMDIIELLEAFESQLSLLPGRFKSQALTVGCKSGPSFELLTICSLSDWKETVEESSYDVSSLSLRATLSPYELRSSNFLEDYVI